MQSTYFVNEQHVRIRQHFAGLVPRMVALLADVFIIFAYYYGLEVFLDFLALNHYMNDWLVFILFFCPAQIYFLLFELLNNGQTPGKRLMNIRVVRLDGRPLNLSACMLRFVLLYIDTMFCLVGALLIALTPRCDFLTLTSSPSFTVREGLACAPLMHTRPFLQASAAKVRVL